jgi:hypothetical protein
LIGSSSYGVGRERESENRPSRVGAAAERNSNENSEVNTKTSRY